MGPRVLAFAIVSVAITAHADGEIPAGYEGFETLDLTVTLRDDGFSTLATDASDPRIAYLGSVNGRFYKTTDAGQTWTESTIIEDQLPLWQFAGSSIFYGGIRSATSLPGRIDLFGKADHTAVGLGRVPATLGKLPVPAFGTPLEGESWASAGSNGGLLGIGLSSRAPRLSILTGSRGKPVPALNRGKFLNDRTLRGATIFNITPDPTDRQKLFAGTTNGLYKSYDGGESWSRSFAGLTAGERAALRVAVRAGTPALAILGTSNGAYTSTDGGDSWSKLTTVGGAINDIAFDAKDANFIYMATNGGVLRSSDGGKNYLPIYYSTFPAEVDVRSIKIDPFDPDTGYIGTMRGAFVTHKLRTAGINDWTALEGVQSILAVPMISACSKHKGHLYALTRLELWSINYGAAPPESAILESWDGGKTWRQLFTGQTDGDAQFFALDAKDPDQLWIGWSQEIHHLERTTATGGRREDVETPDGPSMSDVLRATLVYQGVELADFTKRIERAHSRSLLPRVFAITGMWQQFSMGGVQDDRQFAASRYLQVGGAEEWIVMAWASWSLPDLVYQSDAIAMLRLRVNTLNDALRHRLTDTIHRNYGELQRVRARLAQGNVELKTKLVYLVRAEQLEAVVDLASGGYLTRWQKKHRRHP